MLFALSAYWRVDFVSSRHSADGDIVAIMHVFDFPPKLSCRSLVNLLSRKGMCETLSELIAVITRLNVSSDLLIMVACFIVTSFTPDFLTFSLPAKSTKFNFPTRMDSSPFSAISLILIVIVNIQWDRDDFLLMSVSATCLLFAADSSIRKISSWLFT